MKSKMLLKVEVKGSEFPGMIRDYVLNKYHNHKNLKKAIESGGVNCSVSLGLYTRVHAQSDGDIEIVGFNDFTAIIEIFEDDAYTEGMRDF